MQGDDVINGIMSFGRGSLLAKFDVESTLRQVPVHSDDRYLLGMKWRAKYFIDLALPFGLQSQDKFDRIAALLESWSLKQHCIWKQLESLVSHLQHAYKVIPQGRTFLQRMINLLSAFQRDDHPIGLNQDFPLDLLVARILPFLGWF